MATTTVETPDEQRSGAVPRELSDRALVAIVAVVTLPILWMGYGTDIDVVNVLRSADGIRDGHYMPSRTPGVPVFEALTAVLDPVGGHLLLNVLTAGAAAATVVGLARLVRTWGFDASSPAPGRSGRANGDLVALAVFASPMTVIAATSLADFIWALFFFVWGALAHLRGRSGLAGVLFALSIGCRLSSGFLTLEFLDNEEGYRSLGNNLGRFLYKNYAGSGFALLAVLALTVPALLAVLPRWRSEPLLRFAVLGFVGSEALYFVMPWKLAHLLPALVTLFLWIAASRRNTRPFLWLLIGATALNGVVTLRLLSPDDEDDASTGSWSPAVSVGLLLNDIRCRADFMDEPPEVSVDPAWACTLEPMRG